MLRHQSARTVKSGRLILHQNNVIPLNPNQMRFMRATQPRVLYDGPRGKGSSTAGAQKVIYYASQYGCDVLLARSQGTDLKRSNIVRDLVANPQKRWLPKDWEDKYLERDGILRLKNGATIWIMGMDDPEKVKSNDYGLIVFEEAIQFKEADYQTAGPCLRGFGDKFPYQFCLLTNPGNPGHWIHRIFYPEYYGEKNDPDYYLRITGTTEENIPFLPKNYIKDNLEPLRGIWRKRFKDGKWVAAEGKVYDCFDPRRHIIKAINIKHHWPKIRAIDFGFDHPFVCQWWVKVLEPTTAINGAYEFFEIPAEAWVMYREIYVSHKTTEELSAWIKDHSKGEHYVATYCDHDRNERETLQNHGIPNWPALKGPKSVNDGIEWVYHRLSHKPAALYFVEDCRVNDSCPYLIEKANNYPLQTTDELALYEWAGGKKDEPVKLMDDGCDAIRYGPYTHERSAPGEWTAAHVQTENTQENSQEPRDYEEVEDYFEEDERF